MFATAPLFPYLFHHPSEGCSQHLPETTHVRKRPFAGRAVGAGVAELEHRS